MPFIKKMRSFFIVLFVILLWQPQTICAAEKQTIDANSIHALSAVLLDGDSGRVIYEKEGECKRANASTTKIMTCILALENGKEDDIVTVSAYAASGSPRLDARLRAGCRDEGIVLLWRPAAFSAPHLPLVQKTRGGIRTLHRHGTQPE